jgi:hypothetical protein
LTDPGVSESQYLDTDVVDGECYSYMVMAQDGGGAFSPPSDIVDCDLSSCCQGLVGDVNGKGGDEPTIGDIALLIEHLYINFTVPDCLPEADVNQSGGANPTPLDVTVGDIVLLIDHLYINFIPIPHCTDVY